MALHLLRLTGPNVVHLQSRILTAARGLLILAALGARWAAGAELDVGGNLAVTSDYIYRGVSESSGRVALQADLHADLAGGTFFGAWGSTRDHDLEPGASYDFELYLGQRLELSSEWAASLSARSHFLSGGRDEPSNDYQELGATLSWLDRWSLSVAVLPNAVRYWRYIRVGHTSAWVADTTGQWLIAGGLFATGGAGYYRANGTGPGIRTTDGYAYANAGLAFERGRWRADLGYFLTQPRAQLLFPYPIADHEVAGTLSWRF